MNPQTGQFVQEDRAEQWMQRVEIGEVVKIKGEELEIVEIEGRHIKLKLLSAEDRMQKVFDVMDIEYESLDGLRGSLQNENARSLFKQPANKKREVRNTGR